MLLAGFPLIPAFFTAEVTGKWYPSYLRDSAPPPEASKPCFLEALFAVRGREWWNEL